ncbi:MAG: sulfotransferase [Candidatus Omnitrophica bacterium]|nr:sulfotransferase [Candidatus Omnitrophota bacterium]
MEKLYLERPVFICGHRKTGTTLLINLFDNAKDAVVYPDDSGFFYLYYPRFDSDKFTRQEKIDRLAEVIIKESLTDVIGRPVCESAQREALLDRCNQFYDLVKNYAKQDFTTKEILQHFMESFRQSFYEKAAEPKVWMEKTTSTEIYALEMAELFPQAKFIHLLRDPRDNWASLASGW